MGLGIGLVSGSEGLVDVVDDLRDRRLHIVLGPDVLPRPAVDGLVDNVPDVNGPGEPAHLPRDPLQHALLGLLRRELRQPFRRAGLVRPHERMALGRDALFLAPLHGRERLIPRRCPRLSFVARPVEGEHGKVEQFAEPLLPQIHVGQVPGPDQLKRDAAEEKLMPGLMDLHRSVRHRLTLAVFEAQDRIAFAVLLRTLCGLGQILRFHSTCVRGLSPRAQRHSREQQGDEHGHS